MRQLRDHRGDAIAKMVLVLAALVAALVVLLGCETRTPPPQRSAGSEPSIHTIPTDEAGLFRTGAALYVADLSDFTLEITIDVTVDNRLAEPLYLVRCGHDLPTAHLERLKGERWETAYDPTCPAVGAPPITIPAGESSELTVVVGAMLGSEFRLPVVGTYRLVFGAYTSEEDASEAIGIGSDIGEPLPLQQAVTNTFELSE